MIDLDIDKIWLSYQELGSVHRVAKVFGVCHSTIHKRLIKAGKKLKGSKFSKVEDEIIESYYNNTHSDDFDLQRFSDELGRIKQSVSRRARQLGLSDKNRPNSISVKMSQSKTMSEIWKKKPHPKGFNGHKHSDKAKLKISKKSQAAWSFWKTSETGNMSSLNLQNASDRMMKYMNDGTINMKNVHSRGKAGYRDDLGDIYFRSTWEANFARYLNLLIEKGDVEWWEYEPETFWFEAIKRGVRSYKPDFKIKRFNEDTPVFIEIKGYMDAKSKTKLKRMKKYHPEVRLEVVGEREYNFIKFHNYKEISDWEL